MKIMTEVKERVSMGNILEHYEIEGLTRNGEELVGECPFCKQNGFKANLMKECWNCFGCKNHGNILDFVAMKELVTVTRAAQIINKWYPKSEAEQPAESPKTKGNKPITINLKLDPAKTPFKEEIAQYFEAGYCLKGLMRGRIAIPIHNAKGEKIGYVGRDDGGSDKYPKDFCKEEVVYNLHRVQGKHAYLVDDYYAVWRHHEAGREAICIPGGELTMEQMMIIIGSDLKAVTFLFPASHDALSFLTMRLFVRIK